MRTNLKPLSMRPMPSLRDPVFRVVDALINLEPDETRDLEQLNRVCRDTAEVCAALDRLNTWRRMFGSGAR